MDIPIQQIVNGLVLGSTYVLIALGYTVAYGVLGIINFTHGDVLTAGAMPILTAINLFQKYLPNPPDQPTPAFTLLFVMPACVIMVYTIECVAYRPLRNAPRLAPLITAVGMPIVLQTLAMMIWSRNSLTFSQLLSSNPVDIGSTGATVTGKEIAIILVPVLMVVGLILPVNRTKLGRVMRVIAENQRMASLTGVNPNFTIPATFMIGAAMAAVAGVVVATNYGSVHFYMGFILGLKTFTAVVLSSTGNLAGAMAGGVLLSLIGTLDIGYIGDLAGGIFGSNYQDVFAFIVLIDVLLFRPSGIMGERVAGRA